MKNKPKTLDELLSDKQANLEAYAKAMSADPTIDQTPFNQKNRDLANAISEFISDGAKACKCGAAPMGMLKTPAFEDSKGFHAAVYEVGCVVCPQHLVQREDGLEIEIVTKLSDGSEQSAIAKYKRLSYSARGTDISKESIEALIQLNPAMAKLSITSENSGIKTAVANWNADNLIEDTMFDRIPGLKQIDSVTAGIPRFQLK